MVRDFCRNVVTEPVTVNGKRSARGNARRVSGFHDNGMQAPHFFLEYADCVFESRTAQRVAADEFGKTARFMGRCHGLRTHFVERDVSAALRGLKCGFGAGKSGPDDDDAFHAFSPLASACASFAAPFSAFAAAAFSFSFSVR